MLHSWCRRLLLSSGYLSAVVMASSTVSNFSINTANHQYVKLTRDNQGEWKGPFCFVQGADTQYGMTDSYIHKVPVDSSTWDEEIRLSTMAVNAINRLRPKPKFFVICGDLLDAFPEDQPDIRAKQEIDFKQVLSQLDPEIPLVCVCGNHDIGNRPSQNSVMKYRSSFGDDFFSFWIGGVFFIVINSQYYYNRSEVKEISAEQDRWLDKQLALAKEAKHAVVFQHIPWFVGSVDESDPSLSNFNIPPEYRTPMLDKFREAGISKVFCGHYHRNGGGFYKDDLEVVVTTAVGAQLGNDKSGIRLCVVQKDKIVHRYFPLENIPARVLLDSSDISAGGGDGPLPSDR